MEVAETLIEKHPAVHSHKQLYIQYCRHLAGLQLADKRDESIASLRKAIEFGDQLVAANPEIAQYRTDQAGNYNLLGNLHCTAGRIEDASSSFERVVALIEQFDESQRSGVQWGTLGQALYRLGRWQDSRHALDNAIRLSGDTSPTVNRGPRWWYLTMALAQLGEKEQARAYYDQLAVELEHQQYPQPNDELLRDEAAKLLGIVVSRSPPTPPS